MKQYKLKFKRAENAKVENAKKELIKKVDVVTRSLSETIVKQDKRIQRQQQ